MNAIRKSWFRPISAHSDEAFLAANTLAKAICAEVIVFHVLLRLLASEGAALTRTGDGRW